jgi:hypothetical protein
MPGQLFNDAERRRLRGYPPQVPQEDLVTFFTLTRADKAQVNRCTDAAGSLSPSSSGHSATWASAPTT